VQKSLGLSFCPLDITAIILATENIISPVGEKMFLQKYKGSLPDEDPCEMPFLSLNDQPNISQNN